MDLCPLLTAVVDELTIAHPELVLDLHCPRVHGAWDKDRLEQVFSNLISNALHHGAPGRPVRVTASQEGSSIRVDVHNEGVPIPESLRVDIFNPFRRGDSDSRSVKTAGLGLGLYISREIVRAHGGEIEVRSTATEGTSFRVVLPTLKEDRSGVIP